MGKNEKQTKKGVHLDLSDRIEIERMLGEGKSMTEIGDAIGKSQTTVSREVRKHRVFQGRKDPDKNRCAKKRKCHVTGLCGGACTVRCSACKYGRCNGLCDGFVSDTCDRIEKAPYTCNGCRKATGCKTDRFLYKAERAEKSYRAKLSEARQGISLNEAEMAALDAVVTPALKKGQSFAHIIATNPKAIPCSEKTLYRYMEGGYLSATGFDMRWKLRYKPRKSHKAEKERALAMYDGRRFSDFTEYIAKHDVPFVQMDTLHGRKGSKKCLLTFYLMNGSVLLAFLLDSCTESEVVRAFDDIELAVTPEGFRKTFPVILTDRGSEFARPDLLERSITGGKRCSVFYCDPNAPFQKPEVEKVHTLIRYFFPKTSAYNTGERNTFDRMDQEKITLMANHINSYKRGSLGGLAPFDFLDKCLAKEVVEGLGLERIPPGEVVLRPELLA